MNKTIAVNIGGYVFNIEEDAYHQLKNYLDAIAKHFNTNEGREEIMADIESRIAELFTELLGSERQVVTPKDVSEIISIMGKPEDYANVEDEPPAENTSPPRSDNRKFYRDTDDGVLGGVAAGLSHYFGWDPIGLRIAFILLTIFGFSGVPIYIILWIVVPEARTTAEKLRMKGSKIDIESISQKVNEGVDSVTEKLKSKKVRSGAEQLFSGLGAFFGLIGKMLRVLIGLFLLILGVSLAVGAIATIVGLFLGTNVPPMLTTGFLKTNFFVHPFWFYFSFAGLILCTIVPITGLLYSGVRMVLNLTAPVKGVGLTLILSFVAGVVILSTAAIVQVSEFSQEEFIENTIELNPADTVLSIKVTDDPYWHSGLQKYRNNSTEMVKEVEGQLVFGNPLLRIRPAEGESTYLRIYQKSNGKSVDEAIEHAKDIQYVYTFNDSVLTLDPYFSTPANIRFKAQKLRVTLYIPEGMSIRTPHNISRMLMYNHGLTGVSRLSAGGHTFTNIKGDLRCVTCQDYKFEDDVETRDNDRDSNTNGNSTDNGTML